MTSATFRRQNQQINGRLVLFSQKIGHCISFTLLLSSLNGLKFDALFFKGK